MEQYIRDAYERWLTSGIVDPETKAELRSIAGDEVEIKTRFVSYLSFGTAGLRGIMAAGTNNMNVYTVAHATQGIASLILKSHAAERGVVIAYDSRENSRAFAETAASVLAANGIKTYLFDGIRPTPVLSFAVRYHGCIAGINITASHNPSEYNGYKAYWEDGAQLPPDHAATVSEAMAGIDIFDGVKRMDFNSAVKSDLIEYIGEKTDEAYLKAVLEQAVDPSVVAKAGDMKIVYTPLYGAGYRMVPEILRRIGLKNLYTVDEQMTPNGAFPGLKNPNPEFPEVFVAALPIAKATGSDLIIATDPDCDRVGVMAKEKSGGFITITGNQMGALLLDYIITSYKEKGTMPPEPYAIKTIVSTELVTKICASHGIKLYNVLTGFKFIGEVIENCLESGHGSFIFGFEESYGYLKGTHARDKDGVVASMLICEMAAYYAARGMTLADAVDALYDRYGYYSESVENIAMRGLEGMAEMKALMVRLRENIPGAIGGVRVRSVRDYLAGTIKDMETGDVAPTGLPTSDVMYYELVGGDVVVARPSGTEPKIKIYYLVNGASKDETDEKIAKYKADVAILCGFNK